jgi:FMN phosphatase YigB (HAD superfamily)
LEWLFLDIGGPIIDDEVWKMYLDRLLVEAMGEAGIEVAEAEFASARERTKRNKAIRPTVAAISDFTGSEDEAVQIFGDAYERLRANYRRGGDIPDFLSPGARDGLERLKMNYRLATLSNNISKARYLLDIAGVAGFFEKYFISEEVGTAKPDEAIFKAALLDTGIAPHQGMMVGDRLDNDIVPARRLGLKTALIYAGIDRIKDDCADIICSDLGELADILETNQ